MNFVRVNSTFDSNECSKKESDTFACTNSTRYELLLKFNLHFFFPNREKTRLIGRIHAVEEAVTCDQQPTIREIQRVPLRNTTTRHVVLRASLPPLLPFHPKPHRPRCFLDAPLPSPPPTASLITNKGFQATCA